MAGVGTFFAFRYIDRIGRRKLVIGGFVGMAASIMAAAFAARFLPETKNLAPEQVTAVFEKQVTVQRTSG